MTTFTLDTSGQIESERVTGDMIRRGYNLPKVWRWDDLAAFPQGYVTAAMRALNWYLSSFPGALANVGLRFDMIEPAALAAMLADCEKANRLWPHVTTTAQAGEDFFRQRNVMVFAEFGPFELDRTDDGKVRVREAS